MLSKILWIFDRGWYAFKRNGRFMVVALLVLIIPLSLLYFIDETNQTTILNTQTSQKETVAILHQSLWLEENLESRLSDSPLLAELNSPVVVWLFSGEKELVLDYSTAEGDLPNQSFIELTPNSKSPLIFEAYENEARVWYAVSKNERSGISYALVTKHDFSSLDTVINDRLKRMFGVVIIIVGLLLVVTYWMIRQINWEKRYQDLELKVEEQSTLIATITHEFRAPLTAMQGYLSFYLNLIACARG